MPKLWQKGYDLHAAIEQFTTGEDIVLDNELLLYDVAASLAHARMLARLGLLTADELARLEEGLRRILQLHRQGEFRLQPGDEDVHTKIETWLTQEYGEAGQKIHTGRSRNDQVLVALRLLAKERLLEVWEALLKLCQTALAFAQAHEWLPMPGYTHLQRAMPSSVGLWAGALLEALLDDLTLLQAVFRLNDQCPLGSAAGYGVPLPLDRAYVAEALGFAKVQNNALYCQNSRGKVEAAILQALVQVMLDLSRWAEDVLLFTTREFDFFALPDELCTGSSIMPQKRNVDVLELVRGRAQALLADQNQVLGIVLGLPSGYNRDVQETKRPLLHGLAVTLACLQVCDLVLANLQPKPENLRAACTPELFATHRAYELVQQGVPFREAYRQVAQDLAHLPEVDAVAAIRAMTHLGAPGNLGLAQLAARLENEWAILEGGKTRFRRAMDALW